MIQKNLRKRQKIQNRMKVWIVIFKPLKKYLLATLWPWWKMEVMGMEMVRMIVKAENEKKAMEEVYKTFVPLHDDDVIAIRTIACAERPIDYDPFTEEFKKENWMKWG
jgi:hypothetical protein